VPFRHCIDAKRSPCFRHADFFFFLPHFLSLEPYGMPCGTRYMRMRLPMTFPEAVLLSDSSHPLPSPPLFPFPPSFPRVPGGSRWLDQLALQVFFLARLPGFLIFTRNPGFLPPFSRIPPSLFPFPSLAFPVSVFGTHPDRRPFWKLPFSGYHAKLFLQWPS